MDVVILFFMLGLAAGLLRSELKLPSALYDSLSLVLLLTIGLKGGEGLAQQALGPLLPQLGLVILLCVALTLLAYGFLRRLGRLSRARYPAYDHATYEQRNAFAQKSFVGQ